MVRSILPSAKKKKKRKKKLSSFRHSKRGGHKHFHRFVTSAAHNFVRHEVYTIHLVGVARQIRLKFVGLEIPELLLTSAL